MSKSIHIRKHNCIIGSDYSAQEPRLTSSVSGEKALIDGYNLRNEEFPRGKDYYSQLASAAFNKPYWECTEFRKPTKIEDFLTTVPEDYYVTLENGKTELAKKVEIGQKVVGKTGLVLINKKESDNGEIKFNDGIDFIKAYYYKQGEFNADGKALRARAKGVQLGVVYSMGAATLSRQIGVELDEGKKILDDFFSTYKDIAYWREFNIKKMKNYGFMETPLGRRRRLPDIFLNPVDVKVYENIPVDNIFPNIFTDHILSQDVEQSKEKTKEISEIKNWKKKENLKEMYRNIGYSITDNGAFLSRANTQCTNSVIQGGAADMTKMAMIKIYNNPILKKYGAKLRFLVHDEILIEAPVEHRAEIEKEFINCMVTAPENICKVKMICDAELETRWKLGHTCGKIKELFDKEGKEAVYNQYAEFNKEDLDRIMDGNFDVETEVLRVR